MSAYFRVSLGAVAAGLCCLPLGAVVAQQASNPDSAGEIKPAQTQSDAAKPGTRTDEATAPQADRPRLDRNIQGRQPRTSNFRGAQANAGQNSAVENYLAKCLLKNNQAEIELGKFAAEQAENPQVKQFAQMLVTDHQKLVQQLQQIAGASGSARKSGSTSLDATARSETDRNATDTTRTPGSSATDTSSRGAETRNDANATDRKSSEGASGRQHASMQGGAALSQLAAIEEKISDRCNQALREELQQKSGAEFDECYVGSQISSHMHMLAALEVISQDTQGQLKQVANEARPSVQKHFEHAKQLAKQLKAGGQGAAQAERTAPATERQQ